MSIHWAKMIEDLSGAAVADQAGFKRVQLPLDAVMNLDAAEFSRHKELVSECGVVPEVCSAPLPPDVQVTEMGFNLYVWTEYVKKAARRAAQLGCRKLVWNNGRARVLPWEGDVVSFKEQVLQFLYMLCTIAAEHGITVLVEPLGPLRTNFLNTMDELQNFLERVGTQNLFSMISLREMAEIDLAPDDLPRYAGFIKHVHLENPREQRGRRLPPTPGDGVDYLPFLSQLKRMGYQGLICLPPAADRRTLDYCRSLWESCPEP